MSRKSEDAMGILICGLNGTGKSALGRILADRLGYEFIDNEDLFSRGQILHTHFPAREAKKK